MSLTKKKDTNKQIRYSNLITGCPFLKISKFWLHNRSPYHFLPLGRRRILLQERRGHESGQVPGERKRTEYFYQKRWKRKRTGAWGLTWWSWLPPQEWKPRETMANTKSLGALGVFPISCSVSYKGTTLQVNHTQQRTTTNTIKWQEWCEQARKGSVMAGLKLPWHLHSRLLCPCIPSWSWWGMWKVESEKPLGLAWDDPRADATEFTR